MKPSVGVDIGKYSIKCVALEDTRIKHKKEYRPKSGIPVDKQLKTVLESFTKEHKIRRADFYFTLSCSPPGITTRFFNMPKLSMKELKKGMRYELEEKLLDDMESVYYKWDISGIDDEEYNIMAVAVEKKLIKDLKKVKRPGWAIKRIETQALSLGRLVKEDAAIIDFGHSGTRLIIYKDGRPVYFEVFETGGKQMTERISEKYPEDPEKAKHDYGAVLTNIDIEDADPDRFMVSNLILPYVENLADELRQKLRAVEIEQEMKLDRIYYTGGTSKLRYLTDYLVRELDRELYPLNFQGEQTENSGAIFASAYGAALFKKNVYFKKINFAKTPSGRKIPSKGVFLLLLSFFAVSQASAAFLNIKAEKSLEELKKKQNEMRSSLNNMRSRITAHNEKKAEYQEVGDIVKEIKKTGDGHMSKVLFELPKRTPVGISITQIFILPDFVVISGISDNYSNIGFLAMALEELGNVTIDTISAELKFTITLQKSGGQ